MEITSRDNQRLANARKVRDGADMKLVFVEGKRLVTEALRSRLESLEAFVSTEFSDAELIAAVESSCERVARVSARIFKTIADTDSPQGIILIAKRPASTTEFEICESQLPIVLYLSEINNPSNLGAVLRTAEAAGVRNVIISKNSADPFSPKALRASMGSAFRLNIIESLEFDEAIKFGGENDLVTTGADASTATSYTDIDWTSPRMLVIGSEAHGLQAEHKKTLDQLVCIPMAKDVESLNLAVSVGVLLFEAKRQKS